MSTGQYRPGPDGHPEAEASDVPPLPSAPPATGRPATNGNAPLAPDSQETPAAGPAHGTAPAGTGPTGTGPGTVPGAAERSVTRAGVIWAAVVASLVLLILLIIFILQNQELVLVKFLGFAGSVPLGMALFIAAVTGGVLVAAAGGARILQLRRNAHRTRARQRR